LSYRSQKPIVQRSAVSGQRSAVSGQWAIRLSKYARFLALEDLRPFP